MISTHASLTNQSIYKKMQSVGDQPINTAPFPVPSLHEKQLFRLFKNVKLNSPTETTIDTIRLFIHASLNKEPLSNYQHNLKIIPFHANNKTKEQTQLIILFNRTKNGHPNLANTQSHKKLRFGLNYPLPVPLTAENKEKALSLVTIYPHKSHNPQTLCMLWEKYPKGLKGIAWPTAAPYTEKGVKGTKTYVPFRYYKKGDLFNYIAHKKSPNQKLINDPTIWDLAKQIIQGCRRLHEAGYVHGDLKLDNIFIDVNEKTGSLEAFIGDLEIDKLYWTPLYSPLEWHFNLQKKVKDPSVDIWELGCVLYLMFYGKMPSWFHPQKSFLTGDLTLQKVQAFHCILQPYEHESIETYLCKIQKKKYDPQSSTNASLFGINLLIRKMLHIDPQNRPTIQEVECIFTALHRASPFYTHRSRSAAPICIKKPLTTSVPPIFSNTTDHAFHQSLSDQEIPSTPLIDRSTCKKQASLRELETPLSANARLSTLIDKNFPKDKESREKLIDVSVKRFQRMLETHLLPSLDQADIKEMLRYSIELDPYAKEKAPPTINSLKTITFPSNKKKNSTQVVYLFKKNKLKKGNLKERDCRNLRIGIAMPINMLNPEKNLRVVRVDWSTSIDRAQQHVQHLSTIQGMDCPYPEPYIDTTSKKKWIKIYHLFPYYNSPDLLQYMHNLEPTKESRAEKPITWILAIKLVQQLYNLHKQNMYHGDLTAEKILLDVQLPAKQVSLMIGYCPPSNRNKLPQFCNPAYAPIEWHQNQAEDPFLETIHPRSRITPSTDIWQLGCLFNELFTGRTLISWLKNIDSTPIYLGDLTIKQMKTIEQCLGNLSPSELPHSLCHLILRMLDPHPQNRIRIEDVALQIIKIYRETFMKLPSLSFDAPKQKYNPPTPKNV